jgi:hypothetical protein
MVELDNFRIIYWFILGYFLMDLGNLDTNLGHFRLFLIMTNVDNLDTNLEVTLYYFYQPHGHMGG